MTVWKFPLNVDDTVAITMPRDAAILCVQMQEGIPCIWARVVPDAPKEKRVFLIRGTGHDLGAAALRPYVGTFQMMNGALVFHVFEGLNE